MQFPSSGSTLKREGALSEILFCTYTTARCYNPEDCNLDASFLRTVHSNGQSNNVCKGSDSCSVRKGSLAVPFITAFPILLLFCCKSIFENVPSLL